MKDSINEVLVSISSGASPERESFVTLVKQAAADRDYSLYPELQSYKSDSDPEGKTWVSLLESCISNLLSIASDAIEKRDGSLTSSEVLVALVMLSDAVICMNETLATGSFCGSPVADLSIEVRERLQKQLAEPSMDWFVAHVGKTIEAVDNVDELKEFTMATRPLKWCCGHVDYHRSALERIVQLTPAGDIGTELIAWMITACLGESGSVHEDVVSAACQKGQVFKEVRVEDYKMEGYVILSDYGDPALVYGEDGDNDRDLVSILGDLSVVQSLSLSSDLAVDDSKVTSLFRKLGEGLMPNLKEASFWSVPDEATFNVWARALVRSGVLDATKLSRVTVEEGTFESTPADAVVETVAPEGYAPESLAVFNREALLKRGAA
jgi:hypothetical protein